MSLYDHTLPQLSKMLGNLDNWLVEATTVAEERGFDVDKLAGAWLAPDQFDLRRNIQAACDSAKLCGARLAGIDAPVHEDGPQTIAELRSRIAEVRAWLADIDADAVNDRAETVFALPFLPEGAGVSAKEYARSFALPNTYFHLCMAYAILRHNGVHLGKRAYIGGMDVVALPG